MADVGYVTKRTSNIFRSFPGLTGLYLIHGGIIHEQTFDLCHTGRRPTIRAFYKQLGVRFNSRKCLLDDFASSFAMMHVCLSKKPTI